MATIHCPACAAEISYQAETCPTCGKAVKSSTADTVPPIRKMSGKLQAVGVVLLASGIIATVVGAWWGPALLFPGVVIIFLGRLW
jgi:hypothetical protein